MCGQLSCSGNSPSASSVLHIVLWVSLKITLNANIQYPAFLFPKGLWNQLDWQVSFDETRRSIQTVSQIGS